MHQILRTWKCQVYCRRAPVLQCSSLSAACRGWKVEDARRACGELGPASSLDLLARNFFEHVPDPALLVGSGKSSLRRHFLAFCHRPRRAAQQSKASHRDAWRVRSRLPAAGQRRVCFFARLLVRAPDRRLWWGTRAYNTSVQKIGTDSTCTDARQPARRDLALRHKRLDRGARRYSSRSLTEF